MLNRCYSISSCKLYSCVRFWRGDVVQFVPSRIFALETGFHLNRSQIRFETTRLNRKQRRLLERKQKRAAKKAKKGSSDLRKESNFITGSSSSSSSNNGNVTADNNIIIRKIQNWLFSFKVPGSNGAVALQKHHLNALARRLPFFLVLCYLLTNEDISPCVIEGTYGPSMLPTIQVYGDLWLISTGAWHRFFGIHRTFEVGELVAWKDPRTGKVACKRIIGLEGDHVLRYGQYAHLYQHRDDWAIKWPKKDVESGITDTQSEWDETFDNTVKDSQRTIEVPEGHVWLEGDCPPFSFDSRHVGPIPIDWIQGRLIVRVWPFLRNSHDGPIYCRISKQRPVPLATVDEYLGKEYNLFRITKGESSSSSKSH